PLRPGGGGGGVGGAPWSSGVCPLTPDPSPPEGRGEKEAVGLEDHMKKALITGITGQDGSYLAEWLLAQGYEVHGIVRRASTENFERIAHLGDRIRLHQADLLDQLSLISVIQQVAPDEVYNLAAMSFVPASWQQPV